MRSFAHCAVALTIVFATSTVAAQHPSETQGEIKFDARQPLSATGDLKANGTYTTKEAGATVLKIELECSPVGGGDLVVKKCNWKDGKWDGRIPGPAPGKYYLKVVMTTQNKRGDEAVCSGDILTVTVEAPKPPAPPRYRN
jgi:hypothetical protein